MNRELTIKGRAAVVLHLLLVVCFYTGLRVAVAQDVPNDSSTFNAFDTALTRFASSPSLKHASWGFCAVDVSKGAIYRAVNEHLSLIPASTLKPFTSAPALADPGGDYRYRTTVVISGQVDSTGVLQGNIRIEGGGDPTLGSQRFGESTSLDSLFARVHRELMRKGISSVNGRIVGTDVFDKMPVIPSWQWEDIGNYYGAASSGLTVNENSVSFTFEPGKRVGDPARLISTSPPAPYLELVNEVTTGPKRSGDQVYVYGSPFSNFRWLTGTIPAGVKSYTILGALPDPAFHAAFSLHNYLAEQGMGISMQPTTQRRMSWMGEQDTLPVSTLLIYESVPLRDIVYYIIFKSVNLYAEVVVKTMGMLCSGEGTTGNGIRAVTGYWQKRGVNLDGLNLKDGSGLSRKNLITTSILANALASCTKEPWWPGFYNSFPVAGESGSVAGRFRKSAAQGNLRAKSGTLEGIKSFCGYARTASGRDLAYSLIVNNYSGTHNDLMKEIETLLVKMCEITD